MSQVTPLREDGSLRSGWRWFPLNVGTALAVAVVVGLLAFMLTSNGEPTVATGDDAVVDNTVGAATGEPAEQPLEPADPAPVVTGDGDSEPPASDGPEVASVPPTTVAMAESLGGGDASSFSVLAMAGDITNMGSTEIGLVTNFPALEYSWERIELPMNGMVETGWLGVINDTVIAVSPSWDEQEGSNQRLMAAVSVDGLSWQLAGSAELPADTWVARIVGDDEQVYAFVDGWDESGAGEHYLYTTSDGVDWSSVAIDLRPEANEHVFVQDAAAGPAGLALAVSYESSPEAQPMLLDFGSRQVEIDHMRNAYTVFDTDTGETLLEGSTDELFNWGGEGQSIYDPETGDLITTIPWEVWERAYGSFYDGAYPGGSPLPIPTSVETPPSSGVLTVEYDGLVVMVDEFGGTYSVTDTASGDEITSGSIDYLYQGPPPRFVDEDGEVILRVTWDDWYQAEELSYMQMESSYHEYQSRSVLLTSADGASWDAASIPGRHGAHVSALVPTDDGFVAMVNSYGEFGDHRSVWTFTAGGWVSEETEHSDLWLYRVATTPDGFLGVGEGPGGPALWSSTDGLEWASEFAVVPQNDGSYVSLADVAADSSGTVAVLSHKEKWFEYRPLVVEQDGYTLMFEDGETVLRVTSGDGEVVLELGWGSFDENGSFDAVTWDDGTTYINLDNGDVIAISDDDAYTAMESRYVDQGQIGLSVFIKEQGRWAEAIVDVDGGLSGGSQLSMVDGKVIIGGTHWGNAEPYRSDIPSGGSFVIIVGTPIGG